MKPKLLFPLLLVGLSAAVLWTFTQMDTGSLDADMGTQFSIADTSRVTQIRIADTEGQVALLERMDNHPLGLWKLNGALWARKDVTDLLLKTFKRISVRQPVRSSAREGVLKMIATSGKRVDIYLDGNSEPVKTWFVGTPTQSHTGTHMLLEVPGSGRAENPYVTHMEGFTGFLSTRFFTDENEWRYTGIFESDAASIEAIEARPLDDIGKAVTLQWDSTGDLITASMNGVDLDLPQPVLRDQWLKFRKVHVETWNSHLTPNGQDSLRNSPKAWELEVAYKDGRQVQLDLHWKAPIIDEYNELGQLMTHDGSRMYAVYNGECALVQTFVFNPILEFWRTFPGVPPSTSIP